MDDAAGPTVSHPDKVFFPDEGITKAEVVGHYDLVAERMLPFVVHRPLTIQRFPDGITGEGWLQKNAPDYFPDFIARLDVPRTGGVTRYPVVQDARGLHYLADQGTITFHVPPVVCDDLIHPDVMIFDLDPPPDGLRQVREAAGVMREVLAGIDLPAELKTTGSKGYHLHVFVEPELHEEEFSAIAKAIALQAVAAHPTLLTVELSKQARHGRVFVDWLRNRFPATAVAPYSLRPLPHAPVAAPLSWDELESVDPQGVTLRSLPTRLAGPDPWANRRRVSLVELASRLGAG